MRVDQARGGNPIDGIGGEATRCTTRLVLICLGRRLTRSPAREPKKKSVVLAGAEVWMLLYRELVGRASTCDAKSSS
jgi:hypothetical protein